MPSGKSKTASAARKESKVTTQCTVCDPEAWNLCQSSVCVYVVFKNCFILKYFKLKSSLSYLVWAHLKVKRRNVFLFFFAEGHLPSKRKFVITVSTYNEAFINFSLQRSTWRTWQQTRCRPAAGTKLGQACGRVTRRAVNHQCGLKGERQAEWAGGLQEQTWIRRRVNDTHLPIWVAKVQQGMEVMGSNFSNLCGNSIYVTLDFGSWEDLMSHKVMPLCSKSLNHQCVNIWWRNMFIWQMCLKESFVNMVRLITTSRMILKRWKSTPDHKMKEWKVAMVEILSYKSMLHRLEDKEQRGQEKKTPWDMVWTNMPQWV